MHDVEQVVGAILVFGIFAYLIGLRLYTVYQRIHEGSRGDVAVTSDTQTLFTNPSERSPRDPELQALFRNEDK